MEPEHYHMSKAPDIPPLHIKTAANLVEAAIAAAKAAAAAAKQAATAADAAAAAARAAGTAARAASTAAGAAAKAYLNWSQAIEKATDQVNAEQEATALQKQP